MNRIDKATTWEINKKDKTIKFIKTYYFDNTDNLGKFEKATIRTKDFIKGDFDTIADCFKELKNSGIVNIKILGG